MRSFRIARILGVDVMGDVSLVALGVLLGWVIYLELQLAESGASQVASIVGAAVGGVLFLATVLAHELSHTAVAQRRGLVVKQIRLMIFGGSSELEDDSMSPQTELVVAIAGPVTSTLLGGLLLWASTLLSTSSGLAGSFRFVGIANLVLAVFNLLPGLPLDGGRVLRSILWRRSGDRDRSTRMALSSGRYVGLAMIGVGVSLALRSETGAIGIWVALVGWFLTRMAGSSARRHRFEMATRGRTVGELMRPITESVPGESTIADAIELYQVGPRFRTLVVEVGGRIVGVIGQLEIDQIEREDRSSVKVAAAMTAIGPADVVEVETPLVEALQREAGATRHIVATARGRVVGLIGHAEVADLLRFEKPEEA